jgi:NADH-quinone oxidoreductase subunit H
VRTTKGFDPFAGGYPVPPLPGQTLPPVRASAERTAETARSIAGTGITGAEIDVTAAAKDPSA